MSSDDIKIVDTTATLTVTVAHKDTVAAMLTGMPAVAATPYLVSIAEIACYRLVEKRLEAGQITVGTRVVIDHVGASKIGANLVVTASLKQQVKNRFTFDVEIKDGQRTVARLEHERAAVSLQKILGALG